MKRKIWNTALICIVVAITIACGGNSTPDEPVAVVPTATSSATLTPTPLPSATATKTATPIETPTVTKTSIVRSILTATWTPIPTMTPTPTATSQPTKTPTEVPTETATLTPTATVLNAVTVQPVGSTANPDVILWAADHETGDVSQWEAKQGQAIFNNTTGSGTSDVQISDEVVRSGQYALKLTLTGAENDQVQGARIFRRWMDGALGLPLPEEAYYSAWYYFPQNYQPANSWNVFQFKSKGETAEPMFSFNIGNTDDGSMYLYVWDRANGGVSHNQGDNPLIVSVGQWVHIEAYVKRSFNLDGQLTVWQDGIKIIDAAHIRTLRGENDRLHWSVNNYTKNIFPSNPVIYVDDAVISVERIGPN